MAESVPQVWERQPGEPEQAWKTFKNYRDMARPRSMVYIASSSGLDKSTIYRYAHVFCWKDRVALFDRHVDACAVEAVESAAKDRAAAQQALIRKAYDLAARELQARLDDVDEKTGRPFDPIKPAQLVRMFEAVIKLDRLVNGESTENVGVQAQDLSALTDDQLVHLDEIRKALKAEE